MINLRFYANVAMICASIMAMQLLQSRLFSVVTWYHLSFLVISIAMFGLTLGALKIYKGDEAEQRRNLGKLTADACFSFAVFTIISLVVQMVFPIVHTNTLSMLATLPMVAGVTATAYYFAGQVVTLCLTRSDKPIGLVYGADMVGAACGCLLALLIMHYIDAPSGIIIIAGLVMLTGLSFYHTATRAARLVYLVPAVLLLLAGLVNTTLPQSIIYPIWTKGQMLTHSQTLHEEWNAISRVTVIDSNPAIPVYVWGPGSKMPKNTRAEYRYLMIDGDAGTPITKFDGKSWGDLDYLRYDVTNIAYNLPGLTKGGIIGVGGGRDLLSAQYFGLTDTVALDINPAQINLLTRYPDYKAYSNLSTQPGTRIINSEARSWLSRTDETFDIIQMSMIDTWASTGAGAFALSENALYTVDAFKIFLDRLNPHGVLTVSRWYSDESYNDVGRLIGLTVTALFDRGVTEPWRHIFIAQSGMISTFVLGHDALSATQLKALRRAAQDYGFNIIAAPDRLPDNPVLAKLYRAASAVDLRAAYTGLPYDLSPPTDMRPFFFNQAHVTRPLDVVRQALSMDMYSNNAHGHAIATMNLYLIILLSVAMAVILLVPPLKSIGARAVDNGVVWAGSAYFIMIGVGFMFAEITLMQVMSMFLGHPVYGLGIVLFSLILSTGLGSMLSEKFPLATTRRIVVWSLLLMGYLIVLALNIHTVLADFTRADILWRIAICTGLIFPCGLMMGYGFPTGMTLINRYSTRMTTWFWAVNGAAGVVASALAILISIGWGLDKTMILAGVVYGALALPALRLLRR